MVSVAPAAVAAKVFPAGELAAKPVNSITELAEALADTAKLADAITPFGMVLAFNPI
jgi:hypothetical protein